jgi:hypothetical protein
MEKYCKNCKYSIKNDVDYLGFMHAICTFVNEYTGILEEHQRRILNQNGDCQFYKDIHENL